MENKIIFRKDNKSRIDYFSVILCIVTILLLVFQVAANRKISKDGRAFVEGVKAKRIAMKAQERKALMEKKLEAARLKQQEEQDSFAFEMENKTKEPEGRRLEKVKQGMDYQQKLAIYNQARKGSRQK